MQDLLTLGSEARFNTPGTSQGNWSWRYRPEQLRALDDGGAKYLRELAALYGRDGKKKSVETDAANPSEAELVK